MKNAGLLLICLLCLCSCDQNGTVRMERDMNISGDTAKSDNFYWRLEGSIGGKDVVMHLHRFNGRVQGIYYYTAIGQWINLYQDSLMGDSVYISEAAPTGTWEETPYPDPHFIVLLKEGKMMGRWVSGDNKKIFPVTLTEKYPPGSYRFSVLNLSDSLTAPIPSVDSPQAHIQYTFVVPQKNDWLKKRTKEILNIDTSSSFLKGFQTLAQSYFVQYKKDLPPADDTSDMPTSVYNYEDMQQIFVDFNFKDMVVLEYFFYSYTGGAHGMHGSTFYSYDLRNKKRIRLSDIATVDSTILQALLEKNFRKQYRVKSKSLKDVLLVDHLPVTDNFYINRDGLGFVYNPYEIASYAQGQINVFIPFSDLKGYLQPAFSQRLAE